LENEAELLKQADKAPRESEEKHRSLVEIMGDWAWETDANGIITYVDQKIKDFLGYDQEEVIGKPSYFFIPPDAVEKVSQYFQKVAEGD